MSPLTRFSFGVLFLLLVLGVLVLVLFPQNPGSEATLEILGKANPEVLSDYREQRANEQQQRLWLFLGALLAITLLLTFYFYLEFVRPVFQLSHTLATRDLHGLEGWTQNRTEFGKLARLLARYLREGNMLQEEIRRSRLVVSDVEKNRLLEPGRIDPQKLARDLHDGIIQSVYAIGLQVGALRKRIDRKDQPVNAEDLQFLEEALGRVVKEIRGLIMELEPVDLRDAGLSAALTALQKSLSRVHSVAFTVEADAALDTRLSRSIQAQLYLTMRELVSNALRHARPSRVECRLFQEGENVGLVVWNDGVFSGALPARGFGLDNVTQRMESLGGSVSIDSDSEKGEFTVVLNLPLPDETPSIS